MRFAIGEAVRMTPEARRMFPRATPTGVVVRDLGSRTIKVRRDGLKTDETWHDSFWKRIPHKRMATR